MRDETRMIRNAQKMIGVDLDMNYRQASIIVTNTNKYWHSGYKTGRSDALEEAARTTMGCTEADPSLKILADAIREL